MTEVEEDKIYGQNHYGVTFVNGSWVAVKEFRSVKGNYNVLRWMRYFKTRKEALEYIKELQEMENEK